MKRKIIFILIPLLSVLFLLMTSVQAPVNSGKNLVSLTKKENTQKYKIHGTSKLSLSKIKKALDILNPNSRTIASTWDENKVDQLYTSREKNVLKEPVKKRMTKFSDNHELSPLVGFTYSRVDVTDMVTGSRASGVSDLNPSVGVKYQYKVDSNWKVSAKYEHQRVTLSQSGSTRKINNTSAGLSKIKAKVQYTPNNRLFVGVNFGNSEYIFLEPQGNNFNALVKGLQFYGLDLEYRSVYKEFTMSYRVGLNQYLANTDGSVKVSGGQEYFLSLGAETRKFRFPLFAELYYSDTKFALNYPISTNLFEQKNQEIGMKVGVKFSF